MFESRPSADVVLDMIYVTVVQYFADFLTDVTGAYSVKIQNVVVGPRDRQRSIAVSNKMWLSFVSVDTDQN